MKKILAQAVKEWQEFYRDKLGITLAFLLPVVSFLLFGYGIRLESKNIPVFIQDNDDTQLSREYADRLYATNIFVPVGLPHGTTDLPVNMIDRGAAKAAVIIPANFTKDVFKGKPARIKVLIDGTDIANTQVIFNSMQAANVHFLKLLESKHTSQPKDVFTVRLRTWFNPGRKEALFIVPGSLGIILWMYPALLAAVAMSREKEQGTIVRVFAANPHPLIFLSGKALVYFSAALVLAALLLFLGAVVFGLMPVAGLYSFLFATMLYVLTSVIFGLWLGIWTNSQTTAVQATSTLGFFPCLLLSGFVYPISNIPFPLILFSFLVPARYYIELARDTFVRGAGWSITWYVPFVFALFIFLLVLGCWRGLARMQMRG